MIEMANLVLLEIVLQVAALARLGDAWGSVDGVQNVADVQAGGVEREVFWGIGCVSFLQPQQSRNSEN